MATKPGSKADAAAAKPFFFSPRDYYLSCNDQILNYKDSNDLEFYVTATEALPYRFDLKKENLLVFLEAVHSRSMEFAWENLFDLFPETVQTMAAAPAGSVRNLLTDYKDCSLERVRHNAELVINSKTRKSQLECILFFCLTKSLTGEALRQVSFYRDQYFFSVGKETVPSGTCYLKVIIRESWR